MLEDNGHDYHILKDAARSIKGVKGLTCEIGLRAGGGTRYIIDCMLEVGDNDRTHIALDPFGNLKFQMNEHSFERADYTNGMRNRTIVELFEYTKDKPINVIFYNLEDEEFFMRFPDGVPVYEQSKRLESKYALVYFDGPHNLLSVRRETAFFIDRASPGAIFVYDDVAGYYDHSAVKADLLSAGWREFGDAMHKKSYQKPSASD